jgi:hydrogenase maturation factor HypF (carbamoyltransferase family)
MARDSATAETLVELESAARELLGSSARPIVLARARQMPTGVAPDNRELGVMLPYAPLHALLFASGAPDALVLTSANRASEPIAYDDDDARASLTGIADAFLVGERPIARRVDDSIARTQFGAAVMLRRSRGYAPQAVARAVDRSSPSAAISKTRWRWSSTVRSLLHNTSAISLNSPRAMRVCRPCATSAQRTISIRQRV